MPIPAEGCNIARLLSSSLLKISRFHKLPGSHSNGPER